ncbi:MAG: hypothetical protein U0807_10945 [Candidatus Binatia bacterium]
MQLQRRAVAGTVLLVAIAASPSLAARYTGDATDARTGAGSPATIRTKGHGAVINATIKCKPTQGCPLAKKTRVRLTATGEQYAYTGSFTRHGSSCTLDAYVYTAGFQGTYRCEDGSVGSVGGLA